jgi:hypothetical protein
MANKKRNSYFGKKTAVATFKFNGTDSAGVSMGTVASHGLGVFIPSGAVVTDAYYVVNTTFSSPTTGAGVDKATIALTLQSAGDLKAAIAIEAAGHVYDAGVRGCLPGHFALDGNALNAIASAAFRAGSYILTTAERELTATVAVDPLTGGAGELTLYVEYFVP